MKFLSIVNPMSGCHHLYSYRLSYVLYVICSHYILIDSVDIVHEYQKEALCIELYPG
jgi:FtsH-binding integral membrane protein